MSTLKFSIRFWGFCTIFCAALPVTAKAAPEPSFSDAAVNCLSGGAYPPDETLNIVVARLTCGDGQVARPAGSLPNIFYDKALAGSIASIAADGVLPDRNTVPMDDAKLKAALNEMQALNHGVATPAPAPRIAERAAIADEEALEGRFGIIAKISTAYRLGETNVLAEMAGKAFGALMIIVLIWFAFLRERKQ
jgi:hypothetical protein